MTGGNDGVPARASELRLTISSFGYKYGPHTEASWIIDSRVVRNPFWVTELRPFTGLDARVCEYVLADPVATELLRRSTELLTWFCGQALERGRDELHVAVGCTGGRHRSVVLASALAQALEHPALTITLCHRDVERPDPR